MCQFKKVVWQRYLVVGSKCHWYRMSLKQQSLINQRKTVLFALERYGVSQHWIKIITSYYEELWSWSFSNNSPSRGIFAGCTSSIILFLPEIDPKWANMCQGVYGWLKSATLNGAQGLLNQANTALSWARMALKLAKSRCLVLTDGKFQQDMSLYVSKSNINVSIHSASNKPVKFLGRTISFTVPETKIKWKLFFQLFLKD